MKRAQIVLCVSAVVAVVLLYAFGSTRIPSRNTTAPALAGVGDQGHTPALDVNSLIQQAKQPLPPAMLMRVTELENSVVRGDVKNQQIQAYRQLAHVWDSLKQPDLAAYYFGKAARLQANAQSLQFAAGLFLNRVQQTSPGPLHTWQALQADSLLQQALQLNPRNDTLQTMMAQAKIEQGAVMQGVQQLLSIVQRDSNNVPAQLLLGRLSITSGQYAKAIEHLQKVVNLQPQNAEALYYLAVAYRETGHRQEAIRYFQQCKALIRDPDFNREIDSLIQTMP
ncbi:MAG: tetratricopeptide repeat protein [Thermoflavifilum sp.]|uniref:tetratricopeptide repeat protein n=1 Tax=Thermoflavifilum sp. TaxID=1968839 RepID=UPI0018A556F3|nr:tetratricopeptide repeat protein [Thermoflavifilum sp.]QOR76806.1 MAG: tetratricopeptide repeat protein [Thermoflavifilum sp.]